MDLSRLRAFAFFSDLREEELAEVAGSCEELTIPSGTVIIRQGQVGYEIYLLEEGSVSVFREQGGVLHTLAVLQAPTLFGEMAAVHRERIRTANVAALTDLRLLAIPVTRFLDLLRHIPLLRIRLRELIDRRSTVR